jgi:hypothetical protein
MWWLNEWYRGEQPISDPLKAQGKLDFKGRAPLFLMSKQNLNPSYWHILHTKNQVKNTLELRKLHPPKVKGVKNSKKTNH